mgnify:CR=1 FL=1
MRVVQDANRALSLGRFDTELEVEAYILARLNHMDANFVVNTTISGGVITTQVSAPATDLMPLNLMTSAFNSIDVSVFAQQLVEY